MMKLRVINDHDNPSSGATTGQTNLLEKRPRGLRVEGARLSCEDEFPVAHPDGSKVSHALAGWVMQQHRVLDLGRYPHPTSRTMLLEVHFIHSPQVNRRVVYQFVEFFYIPPAVQGQPKPPRGGVFVTGSSADGTGAGIVSPQVSLPVAGSGSRPASCHPRGSHQSSQHQPGFGAGLCRSAPVVRQSTVQDGRFSVFQPGRQSHGFRTDSPNTLPSGVHLREVQRLWDRLTPGQQGALHVAGGHNMTHWSDGSHLGGPVSLFVHRLSSVVSYPPTITRPKSMRK